jgi:hypothetical protein
MLECWRHLGPGSLNYILPHRRAHVLTSIQPTRSYILTSWHIKQNAGNHHNAHEITSHHQKPLSPACSRIFFHCEFYVEDRRSTTITNNHARLSIKKAKAQSLMSNSRGLGGVGGYFGVQVAGVAAPGAGSAAVNNTNSNGRAVDATDSTDAAAVEGEAGVDDHGGGDGDSACR